MNTVEPIRDLNKVWDIADYLQTKSARDYMLFTFGIYVGLRISDILKLQVRDVKGKEYVSMREIKTGKERRIPINEELRPILNRYIRNMESFEYLFPNQRDGRPITRQAAYDILTEAGKKFGLDSIGTHTLRKTFGYHLYQQTHDVVTIQQILNHSSPQVTLRYIGITQDMKDSTIRKLSFKR